SSGLGFFLDDECSPELLAGVGIECDDMAAERAALVGEDGACRRFHGGYRNVDPSIVDSRRTRALRARMIAGANFPQQPAGLGVQRVNPRQHIDEVDRIPGCPLSLDCRYSRSRTRTRV